MIRVKKTRKGLEVDVKGDAKEILAELAGATASIFCHVLDDKMTEEQTQEMWNKWIDLTREQHKRMKQELKDGGPGIKRIQRRRMPWE